MNHRKRHNDCGKSETEGITDMASCYALSRPILLHHGWMFAVT
jgi:hypothetical protein